MAFSGLSKKFTEFESTTSASGSDVILKSDSSGLVKKVSISSLANILKSKIIGTTSMGTTASTVTGAIAELKGLIGTGGGSGLPSDFLETKTLRIPRKSLSIPPGNWIISTTEELSPGKYMIMSATGFTNFTYDANFQLFLMSEDFFQSDPPGASVPGTGKSLVFSTQKAYLNGVFEVKSPYTIAAIRCSNDWSNKTLTFINSEDDNYFSWKIYKLT